MLVDGDLLLARVARRVEHVADVAGREERVGVDDGAVNLVLNTSM